MSTNHENITREELYDLVWSQTVVSLAKRFGITDTDFRGVCKRYNIPLPKNGHWMKLRFNKEVHIESFVENYEGDQVVQFTIPDDDRNSRRGKQSLRNRKLINDIAAECNTIGSSDTAGAVDKLVVELKRNLDAYKKRTTNHYNASTYTYHLSTHVSEAKEAEALRFLDVLIKSLKRRGHQVKTETHEKEAVIFGQSVKVYVRETVKRVKRTDREYPSYSEAHTGELCFKCKQYWQIVEWAAGKGPLEDRVPEIIASLEKYAQDWIADEERCRSEQAKRLENEQLENQRRKILEQDLVKLRALLHAARRSHECEILRTYLSKLKQDSNCPAATDQQQVSEYLTWPETKIAWYDPMIELEDGSMSEVCRDTLELKKKATFY